MPSPDMFDKTGAHRERFNQDVTERTKEAAERDERRKGLSAEKRESLAALDVERRAKLSDLSRDQERRRPADMAKAMATASLEHLKKEFFPKWFAPSKKKEIIEKKAILILSQQHLKERQQVNQELDKKEKEIVERPEKAVINEKQEENAPLSEVLRGQKETSLDEPTPEHEWTPEMVALYQEVKSRLEAERSLENGTKEHGG